MAESSGDGKVLGTNEDYRWWKIIALDDGGSSEDSDDEEMGKARITQGKN